MENTNREDYLVNGQVWEHFKGRLYMIVGVAEHTETKESMVVYRALYGKYGMYARPKEMFLSEVDHVKYPEVTQKYRFEPIEWQNRQIRTHYTDIAVR
jgi:hypothetical protein